MQHAERSRAGCWIAAILGCLGALGLASLAVFAALFFFLRAAPSTASPALPGGPPASPPEIADPVPSDPPASDSDPPGADDPDLDDEIKRTPYVVRGSTLSELRKQMSELGPTDSAGRHDAYTTWLVRWSYPYEREASSCGLGKVKVSLTVTYTMPDWDRPADAPSAVVTRWDRYMKDLQRHEDGHRDNGYGAARDILRELRAFGTRETCDDANRAASQRAERIVDEYRKKDVSYDATTRHGATQGARFP